MQKILFTGGGSAGHVVPNIALIEQLLSDGKTAVCYMGTEGIEKRIIAEWKIPYYTIKCPKLIRNGGWQGLKNNLSIPVAFHRAVQQAKEGLRAFQPTAVFSKGGYVALPVLYAAKTMGIACFAHESDFSPGLANRLSAPWCKRVFTSFPETAKKFKRGVYSGAPIKRSLLTASRAEARLRMGIGFDEKVLLVFGGGSGSASINQALRQHIKTLTEQFVILHVCGAGNTVDSNLKNYHQFEFISDMGMLYASADAVVARAGSGTVFEILALKKPTLLIPLEGQTRGDQKENARYFAQKGLCHVLTQSQLHRLTEEIQALFLDEGLRLRLRDSSFVSGNESILCALQQEQNRG